MANYLFVLHSWFKPELNKILTCFAKKIYSTTIQALSCKKHLTTLQLFILLSAFIFISTSSIAQEEDPKDKQVRELIQQEFENAYSNKIKAELEKDMPRMNKMKEDGAAIESQKDNSKKQQSLDKFKNDHKQHYQQTMARAGINIQSMISKFKSKFPDYEFSSPDGISLIAEKTNLKSKTANTFSFPVFHENNSDQLKSGPFNDEYSPYAVYPIVIPFQRRVDCGLFSGGNVSFGLTSPQVVRASSGSGILGLCSAAAYGEYEVVLPTNVSSIKLNINAEAKGEGWAFTIGGGTYVRTSVWLNSYMDGNFYDNSPSMSVEKMLMAPILWGASMNESKPLINSFDLTWAKGKRLLLRGTVYSSSFSLFVSGSWNKSTLALNTFNLTY